MKYLKISAAWIISKLFSPESLMTFKIISQRESTCSVRVITSFVTFKLLNNLFSFQVQKTYIKGSIHSVFWLLALRFKNKICFAARIQTRRMYFDKIFRVHVFSCHYYSKVITHSRKYQGYRAIIVDQSERKQHLATYQSNFYEIWLNSVESRHTVKFLN